MRHSAARPRQIMRKSHDRHSLCYILKGCNLVDNLGIIQKVESGESLLDLSQVLQLSGQNE